MNFRTSGGPGFRLSLACCAGSLGRDDNHRNHRKSSLSPLERYAWVAEALRSLPGSGIVYVLTVAETDAGATAVLPLALHQLP